MSYKEKEKRDAVKVKWFAEWTAKLSDDAFSGKVVAITGCTTGIGHVVATLAAERGVRQLIMLNRKSKRAEDALAAVTAKAKEGTEVRHVDCDLQSFASVRAAAQELKSACAGGCLDVLYNNAGVMAFDEGATADGYDVQAQTNHLSHFLLTRELMPLLEAAATARGEARVVHCSSSARHGAPIEAKYFQKFEGPGSLGGNNNSMLRMGANWVRYHQTKLANVVFSLELSERLKKGGSRVKALSCDPGLVATDLQLTTANQGGMSKFSMWLAFRMSQSAPDGALPATWCCFAPEAETGSFYMPKGTFTGPPAASIVDGVAPKPDKEKAALRVEDRALLWTTSEEAVGPFDVGAAGAAAAQASTSAEQAQG